MRKSKCEGCYIKEEEFIEQLAILLLERKIEIVLEERA
jgi:hypothetical protein